MLALFFAASSDGGNALLSSVSYAKRSQAFHTMAKWYYGFFPIRDILQNFCNSGLITWRVLGESFSVFT